MDTLGFDLDGVLYDWHSNSYNYLVHYHKLDMPFREFWEGGHTQFSEELWSNIAKIPVLYERSFPFPGIVSVLNRLNSKYNIVYITKRPITVRRVTERWLATHKFPNYDNVYLTKDKPSLVRYHNCKFYVEDRDTHIEELRNLTNIIVMNRYWNKNYPDLPTIDYIDELEELLEELD